jgi:hypothetical protein
VIQRGFPFLSRLKISKALSIRPPSSFFSVVVQVSQGHLACQLRPLNGPLE